MTPEDVLQELVQDVEAAGVEELLEGETDWPDLYQTYLHACQVLGRQPQNSASTTTGQQKHPLLSRLYWWLYWDDDLEMFEPEKAVPGSETVELLVELLPPADAANAVDS